MSLQTQECDGQTSLHSDEARLEYAKYRAKYRGWIILSLWALAEAKSEVAPRISRESVVGGRAASPSFHRRAAGLRAKKGSLLIGRQQANSLKVKNQSRLRISPSREENHKSLGTDATTIEGDHLTVDLPAESFVTLQVSHR